MLTFQYRNGRKFPLKYLRCLRPVPIFLKLPCEPAEVRTQRIRAKPFAPVLFRPDLGRQDSRLGVLVDGRLKSHLRLEPRSFLPRLKPFSSSSHRALHFAKRKLQIRVASWVGLAE